MLREARESLGLSLRDVSSDTRVRYAYLDAIENGRFHDLPGRTYIPAFLRAYAKRVNLDAERVLEAYRAIDAAPPPAVAYNFPAAPRERRTPKAALLFASCALLFGAYVTWHALTREPGGPAQVVAPVPDRLKPAPVIAAAPEPAPPAAPAPAPAAAQVPTGTPAPAATPAPVQAISPTAPLPGAIPPAPITAPLPPPAALPVPAMAPAPVPLPPPAMSASPVPFSPPIVLPSPGQAQAATPPARQDAGGQAPNAQEASRPPDLKPAEVKPPEPPKAAVITAPPGTKPVTLLPKTDGWLELRGPNGEVLASTFVRAGEPYTVPEGIGYRLTPDAQR
ncbi:MAG: helix-turn-helix domain-containing protein [Alphaproteobacteria bacterium]|nr:helix-turn-helix domain-containing protein [Alphaproteobacteria bacterium]MCW5742987.1 helix-turn-helix domain-containing protein [Alphaproteobacteria bacterium]